MASLDPEQSPSLPFEAQQRIDQVCTRFEAQWRRGPRPELGDFLAGSGPERAALFRELLKVELEYRLQHGEQPTAEEYWRRFPEEDADVGGILDSLLREEVSLNEERSRSGDFDSTTTGKPGRTPPPLPPTMPKRYRIERLLGQGAFAAVYLALDQELNRWVALKVAHRPRSVWGNTDAFLAEARVLASLDHPAILPVYDVGRADGRSYIVTKLIEGSNLSERLRQALPTQHQAAHWVAWIARALQKAHETGLVHRDVKPSNILIDAAERAYIGDFGLALRDEHFGQGPHLLGTPAYMSPEQARGQGHRVDARSDVFSLGVVLYELLTGRPPFQAESVTKTLQQVVEHDPVAPARLTPSVGRDLDTICLKCLEKSPEKRYSTAGALAEDLQRFLDHRPILARPVGTVEKVLRWSRRNPLPAASLAGIAVMFATAFALVTWSSFRAENALREEARQRQEAQQREQAERWERYRSNLAAAGSALQIYNVAAARDALAAAPSEHRNWEWQYYHHQLDTAAHVLGGHADASILFSADGSRAVVVCSAPPSWLLDLNAPREVGPLALGFASGSGDLSPDGRTLACPRDRTVVLWDVAANRERAVLQGSDRPLGTACFSPDGTLLAAAAADNTIYLWNLTTERAPFVLRGHRSFVTALQFSSDSRRLASAAIKDRTLRLWDAHTGQALAVLADHAETVTDLRFSPQGDRLLARESYPSNDLRLWDTATGKLLAILHGHSNEALALSFSPDGSRIATGSYDQTVRLWDGWTGKPQATLRGHNGWVNFVAFSPEGDRLATASQDRTVRLWDALTGEALAVLPGHTSPCTEVRFVAGGAALAASAKDGSLRLWDARQAERGGVLRGHGDFVYDVAFHPDGQRVASAAWDGTVRLWDATTGRQLALLRHAERTAVTGLAFSPDGKRLASTGRDGRLRLWNLETGKEPEPCGVLSNAAEDTRVAWSPQGDLVACGGTDRAVHLWRVGLSSPPTAATGAVHELAELHGHRALVRSVVFSPDGRWLASGAGHQDSTVRIWDVSRKELTHNLEMHTGNIECLAVTRDGRWLAAGANDGTVGLWETTTWRQAAVLSQGTTLYGLAFSPDGTRLACACANNTIRLWDTATHQSVCDLHGHRAYVHQVAFSPDGTRLVSCSGDFTVRIWDSLSQQDRARRAAEEGGR